MGSTGDLPPRHALNLLELVHEVFLGVEPPGRVDHDDIRLPGKPCRKPIEDHRGEVAPCVLLDHLHPDPLPSHRRLLCRRSPKSVRGHHHDLFSLFLQHVGSLGDRRGLAQSIHPRHHDDTGLPRPGTFFPDLGPLQIAADLFFQGPLQALGIRELLSGHFLLDGLNEGMGRLGTHVRGDESSVGSIGDSYDNALAETINGLYKTEVIRQSPSRPVEKY